MSERIKMISAHEGGDYAISELAAQFGVSRKTVYKWIGRHEAGGWAALADQSRAPRHHPNAVAAEVERALLELKERWPLWGAPKLRRMLELAFGTERCPAESRDRIKSLCKAFGSPDNSLSGSPEATRGRQKAHTSSGR